MFFIARLLAPLDRACGQLASLGFLLITLGGFLQALGKLILATTGWHIAALHHSLFILLAPGFVLVAWALWNTFHSGPSGTPVWVVPVITIIVGEGAAAVSALSKGGQRWLYILWGLAMAAQFAMTALLAWEAGRRGLQLAALLFLFYLLVVSAQFSFPRLLSLPLVAPGMELISSTIAWGAFASAAWQLQHSIIKSNRS
jgi:hypothetical protein